ncbi:MAG TPA: hypothetical protein DCQ26_04085 [Marinilabiliales bacterium]|nr:MAG: hypothetical protein A2W95_03355 [Bacteroidetes bacterium GWA2_40_14]OFX58100.1 MAG: hypothetical protein A2W84_09030 [Bacteroidetes bacterium GWC2_40_13]OFX72738.1 MAG: hypothetical protein A2W96_18540 [Bacteroidetes bacterium GWD2_40_43]OFX91368.1 MAG: hypothetical protein A2W97_03960 [Bacteroidetes bacterium GWE2_40_63]OFY19437.1 MAG: hypothetical protein A2W88_01840 [Bacteroidetes bacterium GWF2_40_13]OFZ25587.1 MAG: hypothetical protein A2437_12245 [Bacteroidetes bacterium RIFOXYC
MLLHIPDLRFNFLIINYNNLSVYVLITLNNGYYWRKNRYKKVKHKKLVIDLVFVKPRFFHHPDAEYLSMYSIRFSIFAKIGN